MTMDGPLRRERELRRRGEAEGQNGETGRRKNPFNQISILQKTRARVTPLRILSAS